MNRGLNALTWALNARGISPTAFRLLMHLCSYVNGSDAKRDDYDVWPAISELAEHCEISISGVRRHLKELIAAGFIKQAAWQEEDGRTTSNTYTIMVLSEHQMPDGNIIRSGRPVGCQIDTPPPGGGCQPRQGEGVSPDGGRVSLVKGAMNLRIEPSNGTIESPLSLTGEPTPTDLLGDPLPSSTAMIVQENPKGTILEYVAKGWDALVDDHARIPRVRVWNDARKKLVAKRAGAVVRASEGVLDAYQVWDMIFQAIRTDPWLRGDSPPGRNHDRAFVVEIDHVLRAGGNPNFNRILERAMTNDIDRRATSDPATGRSFGPAEQATRNALARLRAGSGGGTG